MLLIEKLYTSCTTRFSAAAGRACTGRRCLQELHDAVALATNFDASGARTEGHLIAMLACAEQIHSVHKEPGYAILLQCCYTVTHVPCCWATGGGSNPPLGACMLTKALLGPTALHGS